ncbi:hypothetical protein LR010_01680 [Candidatus Gracilibacteria bacterium]|nr:hypothetical protein [Candidatus Gracilibacteria bacterium]
MKKILLICLLFFISCPSLFAIDDRVEVAFTGFLEKIELKYSPSQQEVILQGLVSKLDVLKYDDKYSDLREIIDDIASLTHEELYSIWLSTNTSQKSQQIIELRDRKAFSPDVLISELPSSIEGLLSSSREFIETNSQREFVKSGGFYRVTYSTYFPINSSSLSALKKKQGIVIYDADSSSYRFIEEYELEKKLPYSELTTKYLAFFTNDHKVKNVGGAYYGFNFNKHNFYNDQYGVYQSQLDASGFGYEDTLLYQSDDGVYNFVSEYDSHLIADQDAVFGVAEKHLFLDYLREDSKFQSSDISGELLQIRNISKSLTNGVSRQEGINNIYNWILSNVEYSQNINLSDQKIFSGIETFKNNSGVCTGYTKLSSYLFYFAGYHDVEVIRGHVIDAEDFPDIGHAWLRIGDLYYDPTFDDPVGAQTTKSPDQYKYFGLPRDIFYANRFEYGDMPELFKTASKSQIDQHIFNTLSNLIPKYQDNLSEYQVFAGIQFKNKYNISAGTTITPDILASKIGNYTVENDSFTFQKDGQTKQITHIKYYPLNNQNTESALDILGYDTNKLTLFNWQTSSGNREWRLGYELELR